MTDTPPPAPDSRPRCGGRPGMPGMLLAEDDAGTRWSCPGCPDCQPAPAPSGDDAARPTVEEARGSAIQATICLDCGHGHPSSGGRGCSVTRADHQRCGCTYYRPQHVADREDAIRAESAAALQEARQQLSAANRELAALSSDKQTLMTAVDHWRERAEAAEERLREVEGALRELADLWEMHAGTYPEPNAVQSAVLLCARQLRETAAASRPVPAPPDYGTTMTHGARRDDAVPTSAPPAAPTNEVQG